jgi:hypothetical protein
MHIALCSVIRRVAPLLEVSGSVPPGKAKPQCITFPSDLGHAYIARVPRFTPLLLPTSLGAETAVYGPIVKRHAAPNR